MRHGMRVPSAFHAMRSFGESRLPRKYVLTAGAHNRSRERSSANAAPICSLFSTPARLMAASSMSSWLGLMNTDSSPGSLKSCCAASSVTLASRWSPSAAQDRGRDRQQRAADTIADGMNLLVRHDAATASTVARTPSLK